MNMFKDVNRIIFDFDNTLLKHNAQEENFITSNKLGIINKEEFSRQYRKMFERLDNYLNGKVIKKDYIAKVIENLMPILRENGKTAYDMLEVMKNCTPGSLMDGAKELLEYLSEKGYQIVLFTNWFLSHQIAVMNKLDITKYFERVYSWDDYYAKPNIYAMQRVLENTEPKFNILIGDNPIIDIDMAKRCRVNTIGFNIDYAGLGKRNIERADIDVKHLLEIKKYL